MRLRHGLSGDVPSSVMMYLLDRIDESGDGVVDYEEFVVFFTHLDQVDGKELLRLRRAQGRGADIGALLCVHDDTREVRPLLGLPVLPAGSPSFCRLRPPSHLPQQRPLVFATPSPLPHSMWTGCMRLIM
jgi:hypothetical protein